MSGFDRSREQRMEALKVANITRVFRAKLKIEVKAGRRDAGLLILSPPELLKSMKLYELMMAMPKVGRVKANRVLRTAKVSPSKTLGGLSTRQREEVLNVMAGWPHG